MQIKEWWPRVSIEAREHLKAHLRQPLDMISQDALQDAGVLPAAAPLTPHPTPAAVGLPLAISDEEWTWIEHHG
jgi:hypothetical protein